MTTFGEKIVKNSIESKMKHWIAIANPVQFFLGGVATWIAALLSNGPTWFSTEKIVAGVVMSLGILGASVWHHGARADVYARKHWDPVYVKNPAVLLAIGSVFFSGSIFLAWQFLPPACVAIAITNCLVILFYARFLDKYWPWKNLSIAGICVTPLILGWFSGHRLHHIVPPIIVATFFFYLAREIFKDIVDIKANQGKRFTMVMDIGTPAALKVGGCMLAVSVAMILYSLQFANDSAFVWTSCILGSAWLSWFAVSAFQGKDIAQKFRLMDFSVVMILVSLIGVRLDM